MRPLRLLLPWLPLLLAACARPCAGPHAFIQEPPTGLHTQAATVSHYHVVCYDSHASTADIRKAAEGRCAESNLVARILRPSDFECPVSAPSGVLIRCDAPAESTPTP